MRLDRINQIAQIAANVGILLSIVFLASELRQNRDMMRAQTRSQIAQSLVAELNTGVTDPAFNDLILRGDAGEPLSDAQQRQYIFHRNSWFRFWENMHYQYRNGLYDESEFLTHDAAMRAALTQPGIAAYWCERRSWYSEEFAAHVDTLLTTITC